jgi:diguanylate cyclase (GGDEF)-like protein
LLNRRGLHDALDAALPHVTPERVLAVYLLDLDGFKPVNDQFGHDVGDELLLVVAQRLRGSVRSGDGVARIGGDEFVIMAEGLTQRQPGRGASGCKLLEAFAAPFALRNNICRVSATIGCVARARCARCRQPAPGGRLRDVRGQAEGQGAAGPHRHLGDSMPRDATSSSPASGSRYCRARWEGRRRMRGSARARAARGSDAPRATEPGLRGTRPGSGSACACREPPSPSRAEDAGASA